MKKLENIMFGVCLTLIVFIFVVLKPLSSLDEVWNFNVARAISNGLIPYKDISMVSTPLLGFISAVPLKIFGQELFYSRILTVILVLISFILVCKILKNLDIKREITNFVMLVMLLILINFIAISYNLLALLFVLEIILLELKELKSQKWDKLWIDAIIGIFAGLVICSKQSVGIIVTAVVVFSPLFYIQNKKNLKKYIIKCVVRVLGCLIPVIAFIMYLLINNAFSEFFDYCVKGILTFSNNTPYSNLINNKEPLVKVCSIIIPIVLIVAVIGLVILKCKKKQKNALYVLTIYSMAMFSIVFPIADEEHFIISMMPSLILIVYLIKEFMAKIFKKENKYILQFFNLFPVICILLISLFIEIKNNEKLGQISKYDYIKHFKYIDISKELAESIKDGNEYILSKDKNVYVLDATAAIYMIPLDRYNKDYDMFCVGNLGSKGEDGIIEKIKNEDAIYLIMKNENRLNWQNPNKVRAYIMENMELVEEKGDFLAYQNKQNVEEIIQEENYEQTPSEEPIPAEPVEIQN